MIEHPSGEQGFGGLLDPLVDQGGDFLAQIGGMIEARQLKTLQRPVAAAGGVFLRFCAGGGEGFGF